MNKLQMSHLPHRRFCQTADVPGCEREHGASQRVGRDAFLPGLPKSLPRRGTRQGSDIDDFGF